MASFDTDKVLGLGGVMNGVLQDESLRGIVVVVNTSLAHRLCLFLTAMLGKVEDRHSVVRDVAAT